VARKDSEPLVEDRRRARNAALGKQRILRDLADADVAEPLVEVIGGVADSPARKLTEAPPATTSRSTSASSAARASASSADRTRTTSGAYGLGV
jgi:hypothetical protein